MTWNQIREWLRQHEDQLSKWTVIVLLVGVAVWMRQCHEDQGSLVKVGVTHSNAIELTPTQIRSIERIGQWEFLSVADEELIDTVRPRLLGRDDRLVRIYKGTLRLGIDMQTCKEGWLLAHGDTVSAVVPHVRLLSEHFIDEARTRSFYESGDWNAAVKEAMYKKAAAAMKRRCLSPANLRKAEDNAREQLTTLFRSFGFNYFEIRFE